jgi:RNA polymerase sigma-70 factor (ECF subfamily)
MSQATCWTLIEGAARGDRDARAEFARRYLPVVRAYLRARWGQRLAPEELDDCVQEAFVECLREGGILERAPAATSGFRAYLFGALRNVARRTEERLRGRRDAPGSRTFHAEAIANDEERLTHVFDRAWRLGLVREAAERYAERGRLEGGRAKRRVELLELRFQEELGIAQIARMWGAEAADLHHEYAHARKEFMGVLREVIAFHNPGAPEAVERECRELLASLD